MSKSQDTYCRLCAEPTPLEQLISTVDDVGLNSKITAKMLWINIDVSSTNILPKTICFSCFDLLERTWSFLHNVRTAQIKLNLIYQPKVNNGETSKILEECTSKPVDDDWEEFQEAKADVKLEIPIKNLDEITSLDAKSLLKVIKHEPYDSDKDNGCNNTFGGSSDSDLPLKPVSKKKKVKKRKKMKYDEEILESELVPNSAAEVMSLDISMFTMTWDDYTWCCANCDAQCKTVDSLRLHSQEIHGRCCSFKCSDCSKIIANYKAFISHVRLHYKSLRYHCDVCNMHFKMSKMVKNHRTMIHRDAYMNLCRNCGSNFESLELLNEHLFSYSKNLRRHTKVKEENDTVELKCDQCSREFKSRSNLQAHRATHMERSRDFSCHVCGKMFYTKGALSTHMATHEDLKPFKCEFCPMAFRARGNLTSHASLHSGAKPFVCEQCGKSFRVKRHLKSHSIVHTDLMPYICEYCNKSFRFKTRLNLHIRQHTGAKPYTCIYCRRDFTNGSNYKKHMKRRHNIDTSVRNKFKTVVVNAGTQEIKNLSRDNENESSRQTSPQGS